jgi:hypothetical protein
MEGVESMTPIADKMHTIAYVETCGPPMLTVVWSDNLLDSVDIDVTPLVDHEALQRLCDDGEFATASVGDWGHSVVWPNGIEIGADQLWLEYLSISGQSDRRTFLEWRLRHGLSLSASAAALGLSRRAVAYYSNGERRIPKPILLACRGWEALQLAA